MNNESTTRTGSVASTDDTSGTNLRGDRPVRRRRRRRRLVIALSLIAVVVLAAVIAVRSPSPVGHWESSAGHDRYLAAYDDALADLPAPDRVSDVRTEYGLVRVYRFNGSGPATDPLVLLPGRASASPVWADNLPSLLDVGDVYTIDLLGEPGRSIQERPITDDHDQSEWLDQTLDALPESQFHLVGLSIGGWTATNLALRVPDRINTLTLLDPVSVFDDMPLETIVRSLPASLPWLPKSWRDGFNSYTAGGAPVEDVPVADMIEAGMQHYSLKLPQPTRIRESQLAELTVPVLALLAGESVMLDATRAAETAERELPDARVEVYPNASHAISGEYPDEIAADIAEFLAER